MGRNLMLNIAHHKHSIIGYEQRHHKKSISGGRQLRIYPTASQPIISLNLFRAWTTRAYYLTLFLPGKIVDYVISDHTAFISGWYHHRWWQFLFQRHGQEMPCDLKTKGIHLMGMGVSGRWERSSIWTKHYAVKGDLVANKVDRFSMPPPKIQRHSL